MSTQKNTVAAATQEKKVTYVYEALGLTKEQSDSIAQRMEPIIGKFDNGADECEVLKAVVDAMETTEEKVFAAYVLGGFTQTLKNPLAALGAMLSQR